MLFYIALFTTQNIQGDKDIIATLIRVTARTSLGTTVLGHGSPKHNPQAFSSGPQRHFVSNTFFLRKTC